MLAQKLLEKYNYPYLSIDHLKMGLIRSGQTNLTPYDDDKMTDFLWDIIKEMIKTAVENRQNLIVEGCYIPFNWRRDFNEQYLRYIRFICLAMSDTYINAHFNEIGEHGSDIELRQDDSDCTIDSVKNDNRAYIEGFGRCNEQVTLIDSEYEQAIKEILDNIIL